MAEIDVIKLVTSHSLLFLTGGAIVLALFSMYLGTLIKTRSSNTTHYVTGELDTMAERMIEAERIGNFGSFLWDFEDSRQSFWSQQVYALLDQNFSHVPPPPERFFVVAEEKHRERVTALWENVMKTSGPFSFSFPAVTERGRHIHLRIQGKMTPESQRLTAKRVEGVITDVTKEMEIDRAKTEFVSLASHQLKTPLTSIRWLSEALLRGTGGALAPDQAKYTSNILESAGRMITMVNDLLNVSRIETDTLAIRPEALDAVALMTSVIDEQRHSADTKKVSLVFTPAAGLPQLSADPQLLRMIFQNLLSNAIKYTPDGGAVACDMSLAEAGRELIFLAVKDSGIGIPKDEQPRIFEKLHRASNAENLVPDGTGLGLYLVKTILDRVGGGVSFESVEGKGTTFFATIPVVWKKSGDKTPAGV